MCWGNTALPCPLLGMALGHSPLLSGPQFPLLNTRNRSGLPHKVTRGSEWPAALEKLGFPLSDGARRTAVHEETGAPAPSPPAGVGRPLAPLGQDARGVCARAGQAAVPAACVCGDRGPRVPGRFPVGGEQHEGPNPSSASGDRLDLPVPRFSHRKMGIMPAPISPVRVELVNSCLGWRVLYTFARR